MLQSFLLCLKEVRISAKSVNNTIQIKNWQVGVRMDVKIIVPITDVKLTNSIEKDLDKISPEGLTIDVENIEYGASSLESFYDEVFNSVEVVKNAEKAEEEGFDAVIVGCFVGPGVNAAREKLDIPVIHPGETSIYLASLVGRDFSILDIIDESRFATKKLVRECGLTQNLVSVRNLGLPVHRLEQDLEETIERCKIEGKRAIEEGANVLVLGCGAMTKVAKKLEKNLHNQGYDAPVIEPFKASLHMCKFQIEMSLSYSKRAYPFPVGKERKFRD